MALGWPPPLAVTASGRLTNRIRKPVILTVESIPHPISCNLNCTIDEEEILSPMLSDCALLAPTRRNRCVYNALKRFAPIRLSRCAARSTFLDRFPTYIGDNQRRTAFGVPRTIHDVQLNQIGQSAKCSSYNTNLDHEYAINHNVRQIGKGANMRYAIRWYGYVSEDNTIKPSSNIPFYFITCYWWDCSKKHVDNDDHKTHAQKSRDEQWTEQEATHQIWKWEQSKNMGVK